MGARDMTLYGIRNCDSCRQAQKWLVEHDIPYRFHDLREDGLEIQMLERWSDRVDWLRLVNTRSTTWRDLPKSTRADITKDKALASMLRYPLLVKRPVLEAREFILLGFTPDHYRQILRLDGRRAEQSS